jgi:osmoprotectant transport system ATP-binding protein
VTTFDNLASSHGSVAISLRHVSKSFTGSTSAAVTDLSLDVPEGEIVAFVGPSGCGKTTTLRMINRLIEPSSGVIEVLGDPHDSLPPHELRRRIGYVIQQIGLFPHRTIRRNIGMVPQLLGWPKQRIADRTDELVALVGLDAELLDRYPSELSGGQQQRVGVARALAADPPVLLMDEPYSAVDPIVREHLQDELLSLQAKVHKTIVIVTHDIDEAVRLADRIAILNIGGVLEQYDTPDGLLSSPASDFVASFLGRERGLRRLALLRVADIELTYGPVVHPSLPCATAADTAREHFTSWVAVVADGRLLGWIGIDDLTAASPNASVSSLSPERFVATVAPDTPLRQALDVIVTSHSRMAAVLDGDQFRGMITIDQVAGGLDS